MGVFFGMILLYMFGIEGGYYIKDIYCNLLYCRGMIWVMYYFVVRLIKLVYVEGKV